MTTTLRKKYFEHGLANTRKARKLLKVIARNLKRLRLARGLSMQALALEIGCSHYVIAHVEQAQNWPSGPVLVFMARELGQPFPFVGMPDVNWDEFHPET